ncbi:MAG: TonB-dependent receptor [Gemmatimonadota bacterium]|nr:TonB-dependent receptor [Gemmatimonadota bacterium]
MRHVSLALAALCLAGVSAAHSASAQRAESRDSARTLPGVTTTATRTPSPLLATPLAISEIAAPDLHATRGFGLDEALTLVPGVIAQSRYGTSDVRLVIRGFGARGAGDRSNAGTSRGVRVLVDGFPETEPDGRTAFDMVDLAAADRVEVIRSNASADWGNASGGLVSVRTVPGAGAPPMTVQPMFGDFGLARYAVRTAAPLTGGMAWANFTNTSFDGWRDHSAARRALFVGGIVGQVSPSTRLGFYASGVNNLFRIPGPLTWDEVQADPRQSNATYAARDERRYNRIARLGATVEHVLDSATTLSGMVFASPKYLQRSERGTFRDFTRYHLGANAVVRHGLTPAPGVRAQLTAGADEAFQDGAILFYSLVDGQRGPDLRDNKGEGANNLGFFAEGELALGNRMTLSAGGRYDDVTYYAHSFIDPSLNDNRAFTRLTPKLGASWRLSATSSVYGNIGGGIEVPAGNETDPGPGMPPTGINPLLDPIRSTTYELGYKQAAGGLGPVWMSYDLALYDIEVANEIVPYNGGRFYLTAARARRRGAELGLSAQGPAGLFGGAAVTWSRNRYLDYIVDSTYLGAPGATADYSGHKVMGVPDVMANAELGVELPKLSALRLKAGVEHSGWYWADDANSVRVPGYTLLNLTLETRRPLLQAGGIGVHGFVSVQNVTNRKYIGSAFLNPDRVNGVPVAYEPGLPRTVVVSLTAGPAR